MLVVTTGQFHCYLLSVISEVFEKKICRRVIKPVAKKISITRHQLGYRIEKSTLDAIFDVRENVRDRLKHNEVSACKFVDHSKAFDTIKYGIVCLRFKVSNS